MTARLLQAALVVLAAIGGGALIAWATGAIGPAEDRVPHAPEAGDAPVPHEARAPQGSTASEPKAPRPGRPVEAADPPIAVARYAVCGREEAPARLFALPELVRGAALWAVSCGSTAHVIAIEAEQGVVIARRVARIALPSPALDRVPRPAPLGLLARDASWLIATLRVDRNGSPAGGALFRVPLVEGELLGRASRVHDAAPGALAVATLDRAAGEDFALLQLGDPRLAQGGELWLFSGGASPARFARRATAPAARALAVIDIDADGLDEIAVLATGAQGSVTLFRAADGAPPLSVSVPDQDDLHALDLDRDGKRELVASGARAQLVEVVPGEHGPRLRATPLPALDGLRDLVELDTNADGERELVGYAHPAVVAVSSPRSDAAERTILFQLGGDGVAVLEAQPAHLDGDGALDLIALVASEGADPQVELLVATRPAGARSTVVAVPEHARALRDAPLLRSLELR